jgi:hypothetical protein
VVAALTLLGSHAKQQPAASRFRPLSLYMSSVSLFFSLDFKLQAISCIGSFFRYLACGLGTSTMAVTQSRKAAAACSDEVHNGSSQLEMANFRRQTCSGLHIKFSRKAATACNDYEKGSMKPV